MGACQGAWMRTGTLLPTWQISVSEKTGGDSGAQGGIALHLIDD